MLKIIFNFACTTSHNYSYDIQLSEFIKSVYTQNTAIDTILKSRIIKSSRLKHLKNIWLMLMMKRAVLFTIASKEPFEMLEEMFREKISIESQTELKIPANLQWR